MFDPTQAFTKQFVPHEGGYIFYPSRKSGGKLITGAEFEQLAAEWERVTGRAGQWKLVGLVVLIVLLWTLVSRTIDAPAWAGDVIIYGAAVAVVARLFWAASAPRRLVRNREDVVPPRAASEARREARGLLTWPFVILVLVLTGAVFIAALATPERTLSGWAWLLGSGALFAAYLWVGFLKLMDRT